MFESAAKRWTIPALSLTINFLSGVFFVSRNYYSSITYAEQPIQAEKRHLTTLKVIK